MRSFIILILVSEYFILSGIMKEPNKEKTPKSNFAHLKTDGTCVPNSHLLGTFIFFFSIFFLISNKTWQIVNYCCFLK